MALGKDIINKAPYKSKNDLVVVNSKLVEKADWGMAPHAINTYYSLIKNKVIFPTEILQSPFFDLNVEGIDDTVKYGAVVAITGHEIGHGFNNQSSKYGDPSNLRRWWTNLDRTAFDVGVLR